MKKKIGIAIILGASILLLIAWNLFQINKSLKVGLTSPSEGTISASVFASGKLEAAKTYTVYSPVTAPIRDVAVQEWDAVEQGQTLLTFNMDDIKLQLKQEQNTLKSLEDQKTSVLKKHFDDVKTQFANHEIDSAADVEKPDTASVDMQIANEKLLIDSLQTKQEAASLAAIGSGTIVELDAEAGQSIAQGAKVAVITNTNHLQVKASLLEVDASNVKPGMEADITGDAFPQTVKGKVTAIAPVATTASADATDSSVQVVIEVDNAGTDQQAKPLKPGYDVNVEFALPGDPHLLLPLNAVGREGDRSFVYKVTDGRAVKTEITAGQDDGERVEVLKGLTASDRVVSDVSGNIKDGTKVKAS
ncbi:efflux RND transporter periplasmic adaptor subunit [Paenibacillus humicola]|uniref:efflux RND transporter periplasmic adaptor subunit n=1 Tax=Paenibacillus humicola TaxID=3110540 RepID=UPI00237AD6EF|nr:efflux RND transporter periplasmic adaptor subunit [Paenibacillus humicola]